MPVKNRMNQKLNQAWRHDFAMRDQNIIGRHLTSVLTFIHFTSVLFSYLLTSSVHICTIWGMFFSHDLQKCAVLLPFGDFFGGNEIHKALPATEWANNGHCSGDNAKKI